MWLCIARAGVLRQSDWDNLSEDEVLLRKFDLDPRFGPCMGITRKQRYSALLRTFGFSPLTSLCAAQVAARREAERKTAAVCVGHSDEQPRRWSGIAVGKDPQLIRVAPTDKLL